MTEKSGNLRTSALGESDHGSVCITVSIRMSGKMLQVPLLDGLGVTPYCWDLRTCQILNPCGKHDSSITLVCGLLPLGTLYINQALNSHRERLLLNSPYSHINVLVHISPKEFTLLSSDYCPKFPCQSMYTISPPRNKALLSSDYCPNFPCQCIRYLPQGISNLVVWSSVCTLSCFMKNQSS